MAIEKLKTNTRLKNETWSSPQIKKHKEQRIHSDQTIHTTKIPENKYVKFLKPLTICRANFESSSWVCISLHTKKYKCII